MVKGLNFLQSCIEKYFFRTGWQFFQVWHKVVSHNACLLARLSLWGMLLLYPGMILSPVTNNLLILEWSRTVLPEYLINFSVSFCLSSNFSWLWCRHENINFHYEKCHGGPQAVEFSFKYKISCEITRTIPTLAEMFLFMEELISCKSPICGFVSNKYLYLCFQGEAESWGEPINGGKRDPGSLCWGHRAKHHFHQVALNERDALIWYPLLEL